MSEKQEMIIQNIFCIPKGGTILPSQRHLKEEIIKIHQSGEHAYIIVNAPLHPVPMTTSDHFESVHDDGYRYEAVTYRELKERGLTDFAAVRRAANQARDTRPALTVRRLGPVAA